MRLYVSLYAINAEQLNKKANHSMLNPFCMAVAASSGVHRQRVVFVARTDQFAEF